MKRKYIILFLMPFSLLLYSLTQTADAAMQGADQQAGIIGAETCKDCHEDRYASYAQSVHSKKVVKGPASENACETCHGPGAKHVEKGGGRGVDIFAFDKKTDAKQRAAKCLTCHGKTAGMDNWDLSAHSRNDVSCDSCHDVHAGRTITPKEPDICFECHRDIRVAANKRSHHPIMEGKVNCSSCHSPHGSLAKHMVKADDAQELCYSCHADKRGPYIYEHPPVAENCLVCHTPHGSIHSKLLTEKAPNLCQDCHDWQRHPGTPYDAKTGFAGSSPSNRMFARSCLNCHGAIHGSNTFEDHALTR
jgi:DmsE family decaheme c-type cytochrome